METTYINYKELPSRLQDILECVAQDDPKILDYVENWYEDEYKGIAYQIVTEDLHGNTYCCEPASGYTDHCDGFYDWLDRHGRVVEIELDYTDPKKAGYSDKDTLTVFKGSSNLSRSLDPEVGYLGSLVWEGYTVVRVNGKSTGFKVEGKILTMLE
jgi:hypothetical protein